MGAILNAAVGGAVQGGLGFLNNYFGQQREEQARRENYMYGEMAANNADARTRALYNDFYSPAALLRQYSDAGLSPSMMFGGTPGQGGMSGAQGTGAAGPGSTYMPISLMEGVQMANIAAQTEKTKAEAESVKIDNETKNELNLANLAKLYADAGAADAAADLNRANTILTNIEAYIADETKELQIDRVLADLHYVYTLMSNVAEQTTGLEIDNEIKKDTKETVIKTFEAQLNNILSDTALKKAQTKAEQELAKKYTQDVKESQARILQKWKELEIAEKDQQARQQQMEAMVRVEKAKLNENIRQYQKDFGQRQEFKGKDIKQGYIKIITEAGTSVIDSYVKLCTAR